MEDVQGQAKQPLPIDEFVLGVLRKLPSGRTGREIAEVLCQRGVNPRELSDALQALADNGNISARPSASGSDNYYLPADPPQ